MQLSAYKYIYLAGIGGIGMSALARYFHTVGCMVAGYDKTATVLTSALEAEGIGIHYTDAINDIPQDILAAPEEELLVIYTPAIPVGHTELNYFREKGYVVKKRAEVLAMLTQDKYTIAVAGTHGKTSTASLICHILKTAGIAFHGFLGGIASNYNTNFFAPENGGDADIIVVEADEYDRSFLHLHPDVIIITAIESDHLDIYGSLQAVQEAYFSFAAQLKPNGRLIAQADVMLHQPEKGELIKYSGTAAADVYARNIHVQDGQYVFDAIQDKQALNNITIAVPGVHNIENALAAMAATETLVKDKDDYIRALASYKGVKRRFEVIYKSANKVYVDDYAHHPTEISATLNTLRFLHKDKKILGIFQPHLYSRTRDLALDFAASLSKLDALILLPVYPAREEPIPGVSAELILDEVHGPGTKRILPKEEVLRAIEESDADIILTIGAGDIDRLVAPIKELLERRETHEN